MSSILTVSQINSYIALKFKNDPKFRGIAVKGEISDLSLNRNGHIFFTLSDGSSNIRAIMFAGSAANLRFLPSVGMSVIAYGSVEVYERDGSYRIIVGQLIEDGSGRSLDALAKLKQKLDSLGVFSAPKKPIPRYPLKIAVVTSPTGAALQDIKNIVSRRYPVAELSVFPTAVQGAEAVSGIVSALTSADRSGSDVIILTRGGGSSEDLSAFNAEQVVLAVYNCSTPIISAIGHEIDWSLCDLAADLRAPTPSGAAELATPDIKDMSAELDGFKALISQYTASKLSRCKERLERFEYALSAMSVGEKISHRLSELESIRENIKRQAAHKYEVSRLGLESIAEILDSLNPENVLSRGYALVYKDSAVIEEASGLSVGDGIRITLRDGSVGAEVKEIRGRK